MTPLPVNLYSAEQVRAMDALTIEEFGVPGYRLMTAAGDYALKEALDRWPGTSRCVVLCGAGNNAGDGYVVARLAEDKGLDVQVYALVSPDRLTGDAHLAASDYIKGGGAVSDWKGPPAPVTDEVLLFDGLLGTGLDRDLDGVFADAVTWLNQQSAPVVALDIPTGLHADSGLVMGRAVRAALTVTFVALKQGLLLGQSADYRGDLRFSGLDVPEVVYQRFEPSLKRVLPTDLLGALAPRRPNSHKGTHGNVLLVGGGPGMPGAIRLAGEAALRAGAGLVRVATWPDNVPAVVSGRPEIICHGVTEPGELEALLSQSDAVAVGPGLGQTDWSAALLQAALGAGLPAIIDADGLNLLAMNPIERQEWVITPHPGEAGRLLGIETSAVEAHRLGSAKRLAQRYGAHCVLKGADTLIASPQTDAVWVSDRGNPGMAVAGMGDVLTGVVAGLAVQLKDLASAARLGVLIHGLAGDAAAQLGQRGTLATDLMTSIRQWVNP